MIESPLDNRSIDLNRTAIPDALTYQIQFKSLIERVTIGVQQVYFKKQQYQPQIHIFYLMYLSDLGGCDPNVPLLRTKTVQLEAEKKKRFIDLNSICGC